MKPIKRLSAKIAQKHLNELQNKRMQLLLIKQRILLIDENSDTLAQLSNRGNYYQLIEMIMKEPDLLKELKLNTSRLSMPDRDSFVEESSWDNSSFNNFSKGNLGLFNSGTSGKRMTLSMQVKQLENKDQEEKKETKNLKAWHERVIEQAKQL